MTRVLPDFFYGVKYVVGGTERRVDGCFLKKTELVGCGMLIGYLTSKPCRKPYVDACFLTEQSICAALCRG